MTSKWLVLLISSILAGFIGLTAGEAKEPKKDDAASADSRRASQRGLEPFNDWVGTWKGTGQPKRMSSKGAWTEEAEWAWMLAKGSAGLEIKVKDGKLLVEGVLSYDPDQKKFRFAGKLPGDESRAYVGDREDKAKLVLVSTDDETKVQHRLTFQMLHPDRLLLLAETKPAGQSNFSRVAEVGYTRKGGSFAAAADAGPKCIVTGGRGTISVEYKGKAYYVCCSGCKQAFLDDPEAVIAEAVERTKREAADKKKK